jgi:tRNA U34 5-methylaminomethyl-2-thiouridine-forming methyltransferase MnmC
MYNIRIEKTLDGSYTLFVPELNEHYHSVNGARTESQHVFIQNGLEEIQKKNISILEIGFGTGLNAILSFLFAQKEKINITYHTIERYPIPKEKIDDLKVSSTVNVDKSIIDIIHSCNWNTEIIISPFFQLNKIYGDLTVTSFSNTFDLIYFDAFAPDKQPEMWTKEIFSHLFNQTNENGILTTYCSKGAIRRILQSVGYTTERLPGPPGKREMLRARKISVK